MNGSAVANYQGQFHSRWAQLTHPHVRSLAWLLDSPILLDASDARWANQLVHLPPVGQATRAWLVELENNPKALTEFLAVHPRTRLGHYAEHLLAFYFRWRGELVARSVQVGSHKTIGEFDFLLQMPSGLVHWEFACKFYLLVAPELTLSDYVGPNLMDNLSAKSKKIMDVQLALGQHPEAKKHLPAPLSSAQALLKGWLFYSESQTPSLAGVAKDHCRGLWCRLTELQKIKGTHFAILSRLQWLAPAKLEASQTMRLEQLQAHLERLFLIDPRPVLVAQLVRDGEFFIESERLFVVPVEWN